MMKIKELKDRQNLLVGYDVFSLVLTDADERGDQWRCRELLSSGQSFRKNLFPL
jgi:hypothetical protein